MSTDLAAFLLARIAEDEAAAGEITPPAREMPYMNLDCAAVHYSHARVLAECEAKRRIVELHGDGTSDCRWDDDYDEPGYCVRCVVDHQGERWPCETLRLLAAPYADHPEYCEEWRP